MLYFKHLSSRLVIVFLTLVVFLSLSMTLIISSIIFSVTTVSLFNNYRYSPFASFAPRLFGSAKPLFLLSFNKIILG